jgi:GAF domain-containing protein
MTLDLARSKYEEYADAADIQARGTQTIATLPLALRGRPIGLLSLESDRQNAYGEEELHLLQRVADIAAVALENTRLFADAEERAAILARQARDLAALNRMARTVSSALDLNRVLGEAMEELARAFAVAQCQIALLSKDGTSATIVAQYTAEGGVRTDLALPIPVAGNASMEQVIASHEPLAIFDAFNDPRMASVRDLVRERGTQSILIVPVISRGQVLGTIGLDSIGAQRAFSPAEITLAQSFADQLATAIDNTRFFAETQTLARREQLINEITARIRSTTDIAAILQTAVHELNKVIGSPRAYIQLGTEKELALVEPTTESSGDGPS